ncbi:MAG: efflux RND transporter periplasmic adaptor subunit [Pseudomonadota bacterium]
MSEETKKPTALRRTARIVLDTAMTLGVVGAAGFAVVMGSQALANRAADTVVVETADLMPVSVTELKISEGYTLPRRFVGQVEAASSVVLSFEFGGRLSQLLVEEGTEVAEGALLARLDTALLSAEANRLDASRAATVAQLDFAESRLKRALALRKDGFSSQEAVDQAQATRDELQNRIRETDALLASVAINLEKSELFAPFAGRVGLRNVDGGETLAAGTPVLTLIETAAPQVRVGLPLSVKIEQLETAQIEVNGETHPAHLLQVRPDIDPVTRTRTAIFAIEAENAPTFGQTARLLLQEHVEAAGTWLPLDALQEGLGGGWTVLVVDEGVVRSAMVEVLYADAARAYVRGTFSPGAQMIAAGAHRIVPGQQVRILAAAE